MEAILDKTKSLERDEISLPFATFVGIDADSIFTTTLVEASAPSFDFGPSPNDL